RVRRSGPATAAAHRSDLSADRGHLRVEHRRGPPGDRGGADPVDAGRTTQCRGRQPGSRGPSHLRDLGWRGRPVDNQHASGVPFPSLDDDATRPRLISHVAMSNTKLIGGPTVRWDAKRTAEAYARGWWVRETLADSLSDAALRTPQRVVLIDGDYRLGCHSLHEQVTALAQRLLERSTSGS